MSDLMSQATRARFGAAILALAPAMMLAGLFAHQYYARLARYHGDVGGLVPDQSENSGRTATRTATGLVRTGTLWTK